MRWIRLHPYAFAGIGACILVLIGAIFVLKSASVPSPAGISTWSGNPSASEVPGANPPATNTVQPATTPVVAQNYGTATLPYKSNTPVSVPPSTTATGNSSPDLNALLAEIARPKASSSTEGAATGGTNVSAWSYIPSGLISTTSLAGSSRSPAQQALFTYGNEIGSLVEGYDAQESNQSQVIADAMNDRQNAAKQAAVASIGQNLETIGDGIAQTTGVPASAVGDNTALAESYTEIGKDLVTVGQSEALSDSALVSAIETYDTAVNTFNKKYIALSTLFSLSGVTFSTSDPGSVFSFTASSNL